MTKKDLIKEVADTVGIKKGQAEKIINIIFNAIKRSLSEEEIITIVGFGIFEVVKTLPRVGCVILPQNNGHTKRLGYYNTRLGGVYGFREKKEL